MEAAAATPDAVQERADLCPVHGSAPGPDQTSARWPMSRAGEQASVVMGAMEAVRTGQVKLVKVTVDASPQIVVVK
jgi:hypothetical protein